MVHNEVTKNVIFDKTRAQTDPTKADRDLYTNLNTRALRKMEATQMPDWVEFYSEEIRDNVAEALRQEEARGQMRLDAENSDVI